MPKRGELYNAMLNGSSSDALTLTCMHLHDSTTTVMEDDWINFSALIGKTPELSYGSLWNQMNKSILDFIDAEEVDAKDAMIITIQLMLLYKRCNTNYQPHTIDLLRKKIIQHFPENAKLSSAGLAKYTPILSILNDIQNSSTSSESDISLFCQRILAGLSKLMSENNYDDMRYSLEYLCKKKIVIPLPSLYPCPNMEEAEKGDIIWFLWGAILCFYGDKNSSHTYNEVTKSIVFTNYSLFIVNWKRTLSKDRLGLLWGVSYALNTNVVPEWTYNEKNILDTLDTNATTMWKSFLDEQREIMQESIQSKSAAKQRNAKDPLQSHLVNDINILESFIPRKPYNIEDNDDDEDTQESESTISTLHSLSARNSIYDSPNTYNTMNTITQYNTVQNEDMYKEANRRKYDAQLEQLEQTIPFIKTLYIDKSNAHSTSASASASASKSTSSSKKRNNQTRPHTRSQLETTELLLKSFDSKHLNK